jgi:CBS-domain-containing membrane protein
MRGVETAAEIMRDQAIRRLAVVDGEQLVGIVSIGDLAIRADPKRPRPHLGGCANS